MSFVSVVPELATAAATDCARIGSELNAANAAAAGSTTGVAAAAADEVSVAIAELFGRHAQQYQAATAQAAAFHEQLVQGLAGAANSYAGAEAANVTPLQALLNLVNAPTDFLLGRPLIANGTNGQTVGGVGGLGSNGGANGASGGGGLDGGAGFQVNVLGFTI